MHHSLLEHPLPEHDTGTPATNAMPAALLRAALHIPMPAFLQARGAYHEPLPIPAVAFPTTRGKVRGIVIGVKALVMRLAIMMH